MTRIYFKKRYASCPWAWTINPVQSLFRYAGFCCFTRSSGNAGRCCLTPLKEDFFTIAGRVPLLCDIIEIDRFCVLQPTPYRGPFGIAVIDGSLDFLASAQVVGADHFAFACCPAVVGLLFPREQ